MWWRISTTKVQLDPGVDPDEDVTITIDSTGIKISNRGEWIRQKWMVKSGFVKVHLAVDTKIRKILLMQVTKEDVHDRRIFVPLVEEEASSTGSVTRAIGDGAYDSREIFRHLDTNSIEPVIKVRKDASLHTYGACPRSSS
ncbi:MAG: transposase [Thaumarchaeota archaeon]|nr:MAG: transposase [Nitrososphaerota archaeon]